MGLLNPQPAAPVQADPMQAAPAQAEAAPPERKINGMSDQEHFGRIVTTGLKILYSPKMIALLKPLFDSGEDYSTALAERIVTLVKLIDEKVQYKFPRSLMIPIALYITMDFLKWMKDEGIGNLTPDIAKSVMQQVPEMLIAEYKLLDEALTGQAAPAQPGMPVQATPAAPSPAPAGNAAPVMQ